MPWTNVKIYLYREREREKKLGGITNESIQIWCVCAFFFCFHVIIFRFENETKSKEEANRILKK